MTRGAASERAQLHKRIEQVLHEKGPGPEADKALNECPDMECPLCSFLVCPEGHEMHFHHDGCPACAEASAFNSGGRD